MSMNFKQCDENVNEWLCTFVEHLAGIQRFMAVLPKPRIGIAELGSRIKDTVY